MRRTRTGNNLRRRARWLVTGIHGSNSEEGLFAGPGQIRQLCRTIDWSATPLGPAGSWPPSLRAAVRLCLQSSLPMAVWAGPDLTLIYNQGYPPILGPARHPWALGRPGREVWPDLWDRLGPELHRVMGQGETVHHEGARFLLERGAGEEEAFFNYAYTPILEEDGRVVGALNIFNEVTERVRSTLESEERYRKLVELFPDAVLVHQDGRVVFANPGAARLFGASGQEELLGKDFLGLAHPDDRAFSGERIAQDGGPTPWGEIRMRRVDGREVLCEISGAGIEYRNGPAVQVVMRDITERKRAEEALRASETRIRAHMDNSPLATIEFDSEFRIRGWSQQAERVFGWSAGEVLGRSAWEIRWVFEEDSEAVAAEMACLQSGKRPRSHLYNRNYRKDGSLLDCEWYNSALFGKDGALVSVLSQVLDVSDSKRAEQALLAAKARLEEADRNKTHFLAMLSHELRNPLTPIRNSLYVLERAAPGGGQAKRAQEVIARQVGHMIRLVDDLLDVTRIARGKIHIQRERLELNELAHGAVEDNRSVFAEKGVRLDFRPAPNPVRVRGDRVRLAQVIGNLLVNAAKFTPSGGSTTVSIQTGPGQALLAVSDTGAGLEPEILSSLFEPFVQADLTMDRARGGLGLGLALVKGLVEEHGGSVAASSSGPGQGSEFLVRLPLDLTEPAMVAAVAASPARHHGRVLVIEDNVDAAESLREFLQLEGHEVAVAFTGPDGVASARDLHPEVVLCDIGLPGMDGYAVARAIRAEEGLRDVRLVALTGYAGPEDLRRAAEAGFDLHLAKPPSLEKLEGILGAPGGA